MANDHEIASSPKTVESINVGQEMLSILNSVVRFVTLNTFCSIICLKTGSDQIV